MERMQLSRIGSALLDNLIWVFVFIAFVTFSILSDHFLSPYNFGNILLRTASLGMLVLSQSYTFITGNFDLSVESTMGFTAMLAALLLVPEAAGGLGVGRDGGAGRGGRSLDGGAGLVVACAGRVR